MGTDDLLRDTLWLAILLLSIAVAHVAFRLACRGLSLLVPRATGRLAKVTDWYLGSRAGAYLERTAPRTVAFVRARLDTKTFVGWPLTAMALCAAVIAMWMAEVAEDVVTEPEVQQLDEAILAAISDVRSEPLLSLFYWITGLGGNPALVAAAVVGGVMLWAGRRKPLLYGLTATAVGSQVTLWIGKYAFDRSRPEFLTDATAISPSFPSGHTTSAMAIYGFLGYAAAHLVASGRARVEIAFWTALVVILVGVSRIYLHVHYPSDVLAGLLLGGLWVLVGVAIAQWRSEVCQRREAARTPSGAALSAAGSRRSPTYRDSA
jgi:membrane-associated phospholipid phosphatase